MKYKNEIFDDYVIDEYGIWSQVCIFCKNEKFYDDKLTEIPIDGLKCGVFACNNIANYYIDFNAKELDKTRISNSI